MTKKCTNVIVGWLVRCDAIEEKDRELYQYAVYSVLLSTYPLLFATCFGVVIGEVERSIAIEKYNNKVNEANAKYVWDELIKAGFTKEAAAGIMGNLDAESAFKTDWSGDQGSVGIAQWRGTRKENLVKYAKENNGSETDIRIQTGFLIHQDLVARIGSSGVEKLKRMNDYIDATDYFCDKVESPSSYKNKSAWENGKYGPNYAQHGDTYQIKWERYTWSDQAQKYL